MQYHRTYVLGMALKKMADTLKVTALECSLNEIYQELSSASTSNWTADFAGEHH